MKEKNDVPVRYFIFASFHENQQLSAHVTFCCPFIFGASWLILENPVTNSAFLLFLGVFLGRMLVIFFCFR
jgi:hypothetical protein